MPEHGGRIAQAALQYGIAASDWLDLSTGINPRGYPVPAIPAAAWQRLPEDEDDLAAVACAYYGVQDCARLLPIAGTQAAIQALPRVLGGGRPLRIAVAGLTYNEYAHAWRRGGHAVSEHAAADLLMAAAAQADVVVVCQPNNPTGYAFPTADLLRMRDTLAARQGWLLIDEAYRDADPSASVIPALKKSGWQHVIVLRSVGKFFGLAGARVGFALAEAAVVEKLRDELGPWPIAGPARYVATRALRDTSWQEATRVFLAGMSGRLDELLSRTLGVQTGGTSLFRWFEHAHAEALHEHLARAAILIRKFAAPAAGSLPSLRIGLPADDTQLARLARALESFR
jgi:cobalamin biosynthetic protein CobC